MPIYEFKCEKCGDVKEELVFEKQFKAVCDFCKVEMTKLISRPNGYVKETTTPTKS